MPRKPPNLKISLSAEGTTKPASFKLTDTGNFQVLAGKHGSFKVTLNAHGGFASPMAKKEMPNLKLDDIQPLEELGAGAGGTVRLAKHTPTGRLLALKIIHVAGSAREQRHMLLNELRLLCKLQHPNLVTMYDCFQLEGIAYLALKFMDGGSLESCCNRYTRLARDAGLASLGLPEPVLGSILFQALCGLDYLHDRSLLHRDLKPANVLLDARSGVCALSDFGIAKELADDQRGLARSFVGTAAYMAPERLNGEAYSASADLWSLGMILLECAEGAHPWRDAASYYDLVVEISHCRSPPKLSEDGRHSEQLRALAAACLAPSPAERPSSRELCSHPFLLESLGQGGRKEGEAAEGEAAEGEAASLEAEATEGKTKVDGPIIIDGDGDDLLTENECFAAAAQILGSWLASTIGPAHSVGVAEALREEEAKREAEAVEAVELLDGEHVGGESSGGDSAGVERSASRIQAWLRGERVRRELEELRCLEEEIGELGVS